MIELLAADHLACLGILLLRRSYGRSKIGVAEKRCENVLACHRHSRRPCAYAGWHDL